MSAHFSDPYTGKVHEAITGAPRGINFGDLANECPPEESGDLNDALKELRKMGLIEMVRGLYVPAPEKFDTPVTGIEFVNVKKPADKLAGAAQPVFHPQTARLITPTLKEHLKMKQPIRKGMPATIAPRILELLKDGPCLLGTLVERDGGQLDARAIKNAVNRLKASGEIKSLGGTPHRQIIGLAGAKLSVAEMDAMLGAAKKTAKPAKPKGPKKPAAKIPRTKGLKTFAEQRANLGAAAVAAAKAKVQATSRNNGDGTTPSLADAMAGKGGLGSFRVGLFSDGTLSIIDTDCEMQIGPEKTRALIRFLDQLLPMFGAA